MLFYQYWLVLIIVILTLISIINISKMLVILSKDKGSMIPKTVELNKNIRNLLLSMALLTIVTLIFIILVFVNKY